MRPIDADFAKERIKNSVLTSREKIELLLMLEDIPTLVPPPNDPLTIEQLREMDGEPVWVEIIIKTVEKKGGWAICYFDSASAAAIQRWTTWTLWYEDYGKTWLAYRRKPEGEQHGKTS